MERYNRAARALPIPRLTVTINEVLDYLFLGQFELLRESRHNLLEKCWARPAEREAAMAFHKLQRSYEELERCSIEARRLLTFLQDVERELQHQFEKLEETDSDLAHQIQKRLSLQQKLNDEHRCRVTRMEHLRKSRISSTIDTKISVGKAVSSFVSKCSSALSEEPIRGPFAEDALQDMSNADDSDSVMSETAEEINDIMQVIHE